MADTVIRIENLSKQYRLGDVGRGTLIEDLNRWWHKIRGKEDPYLRIEEDNKRTSSGNSQYLWALRDINFEVKEGDVLGIIGKNGAGKSTLLKILSQVTRPTSGRVMIRGRVASLLEVGTGFHPDLTGRENIFLNGAILGMSKEEIRSRFDEIVEFSGISRYIDTPVKRYSSGMYVRLAFAVAAHLEPEILIVDEVLAVGDVEFQKKCLGKMKDVAGQGRTVLFVSHNMEAVRRLCKNGLLLSNGKIEQRGMIEDIIPYYLHQREQTLTIKPPIKPYRIYDISKSPIYIEDIYVLGYSDSIPTLSMDAQPEIVIRIKVKRKISGAAVGVTLYNSEGINIGIAFSWDDNFYLSAEEGTYDIIFKLNKIIKLTPGQYSIGVGLNQSTHTVSWDGIKYYPIFNIENINNVKYYTHRHWGINHLVGNVWEMKKINVEVV